MKFIFLLLLAAGVAVVKTSVDVELDDVMEKAMKELDHELRKSTIEGASSRRFARKKFTAL